MYTKFLALFLTLAILLGLSACNLPFISPSGPSVDITAAIQTIVAGTLTAQPTLQAETLVASPEPTFTPPPTLTLTPSLPMLSVSQNTYCRTGPGTEYDLVTTVNVGDKAEVIAKDPYNDSWYIRNPDNPLGFCWVWGQYATVTGNSEAVPVFTPPPTPKPSLTPTPSSDFSVQYKVVTNCGALYAPTFNIVNTGGTTWESVQIVVTDTVTATTKTHTADTFDEYNGCILSLRQHDLASGEPGGVTTTNSPFNAPIAGHAMQATIKVCSQNGMLGTCISKTINFTP